MFSSLLLAGALFVGGAVFAKLVPTPKIDAAVAKMYHSVTDRS